MASKLKVSDLEASGEYLQNDFDPSDRRIKKDVLNGLLNYHGVNTGGATKKEDFVELFNEHIVPNRAKWLRRREKVRRESAGIVNADRYDDNGDLIPATPATTRKSTRASSRVKSEEVGLEPPSTRKSRSRSPTKKTPRASTGKHARGSDLDSEVEIRRTVRKTKKSETPVVKEEEEETEDEQPRRHGHERAFSDENPFQRGSSPVAASRSPSGQNRRRTAHDTPAKGKSTSNRRHTEGVRQSKTDQGIKPPSRATFDAEIPVSTMNELIDYDDNGVEAGEEFTPDAQEEVLHDIMTKPKNTIVRRPRKKAKRSKGRIAVVLMAMLGGYATWYRQEKLAVGYCGIGRPATSVIPHQIDTNSLPEWAVTLVEPQCEPCPQHAYCFEGLETSCEPDFVLQPHPLSLGGLVPLPPTCEPDGDKVRKIKVVADRAVEELRERRAKFECGQPEKKGGKVVKEAFIDEGELKQKMGEKRKRSMSESEFEALWGGAIGEIHDRDEVDVEHVRDQTPDSRRTRLSSNSLANIPLSCAVRRYFRHTLERYRLHVGVLILSLILAICARLRYASYLSEKAAIPHLVALTLDRLSIQATRHANDPISFKEDYIPISQLRDDVLRDEHSLAKRNALWQKVRSIVEMNANVRSAQRQDRNGEITRVWEWIGAVSEIEDTPARSARRKSGRVSWVESGDPATPEVTGRDEGAEVVRQKWQEGRPIY